MGHIDLDSDGIPPGLQIRKNALLSGLLHEADHHDGRIDVDILAAEFLGGAFQRVDGLQPVLYSRISIGMGFYLSFYVGNT